MTKIDEKAVWPSEIYQIRRGDTVSGGKDGVANIQAGQLADRTAYLKKSLESFSVMIQSGDAPYTDESAAQAAINAGKIAEGALFSVRSTDPMIWVAEYKNQGGVPVATGKVIADSRAI
ncbi:SGNH/GDSL hydrolase family protein, partial [Klebsiella pneumoniae]|nr:SGNH/GDSL hydrolase family protein [Klebsiella pneumoniae]